MTKDTLTFNISPRRFDIEPGQSAEAEIYVRNDSLFVDVYNISVKGRGADWAHVSTPSASIFPGDHVIGKLIVDIPRSYSSESGKYELTVSVNSNRSSHAPRQVSLDINVPEYQEMSAVITEVQQNRSETSCDITIYNMGNAAITCECTTMSTTNYIFCYRPPSVSVLPGGSETIEAVGSIKPGKRQLLGLRKECVAFLNVIRTGTNLPPVELSAPFTTDPLVNVSNSKAIILTSVLAITGILMFLLVLTVE